MKYTIEDFSLDVFLGVMHSARTPNALFRHVVDVDEDDSVKTLLIVGEVHPLKMKGYFTAILNPDELLLFSFSPAEPLGLVGLEMMRGKCDSILIANVDASLSRNKMIERPCNTQRFGTSPSRFSVKDWAAMRVPKLSGKKHSVP